MIELEIENMLRIESAAIRLEPATITTVCGPNEAGKTSIALLVGAIMSRAENPVGVGKTQGKIYLRDDADSGYIQVGVDGEAVARWDAVSGEIAEFDAAKARSTQGTVGLVRFTSTMTPQVRTQLWEGYFLPPPAILVEAIEKQLADHMSKDKLEEIMTLIDEGEMKNVLKAYEDRRRRAKSAWEATTGERYGEAKGADWIPERWTAEMDGLSRKAIEDEMESARDELRSQQVEHAVSTSEIEEGRKAKKRLAELDGKLRDGRSEYRDLKAAMEENSTDMDGWQKNLKSLKDSLIRHHAAKPEEVNTRICGSCGTHLIMSGNKTLVPYNREAQDRAIVEWTEELESLEQKHQTQKNQIDRHEQEVLEPYRKRMNEIVAGAGVLQGEITALQPVADKAGRKAHKVDQDAMREAEERIEDCRVKLEMYDKREKAQTHHLDVLAYNAVVSVLGPKGVRATMVAGNMEQFRGNLERIHEITGWAKTEIDNSYNLSIGGRKILEVCGETPRLRAQYAVQIALALCRKEPVVILDMVDHLEHVHQQTLANLIVQICGKLPNEGPAFLLCGTDGHFNPDIFRQHDGIPGGDYRVVEGVCKSRTGSVTVVEESLI